MLHPQALASGDGALNPALHLRAAWHRVSVSVSAKQGEQFRCLGAAEELEPDGLWLALSPARCGPTGGGHCGWDRYYSPILSLGKRFYVTFPKQSVHSN